MRLKVEDLWVRYENGAYALRGITLSADRGLVVIAGKTGSGKTTLARCIAGIIPNLYRAHIRGKVRVCGIDPSEEYYSLAGRIAYIPQNPEMFITHLSVMEEIASYLSNVGADRERILERITWVAEKLNISGILHESTLVLSSGQLQLVAIASALAADVEVLLLDEPLARLDPWNAARISNLLREIADEGRLVLVFEHHMDEILGLADEVYVLDTGRVVASGTPRDILMLLEGIDIPDISEAFLTLYREGLVGEIPLSIEEALRVLEDARAERRMV